MPTYTLPANFAQEALEQTLDDNEGVTVPELLSIAVRSSSVDLSFARDLTPSEDAQVAQYVSDSYVGGPLDTPNQDDLEGRVIALETQVATNTSGIADLLSTVAAIESTVGNKKFGEGFAYDTNTSPVNVSGTSWVTVGSLTLTPSEPCTYLGLLNLIWSFDSTSRDFQARILLDGVQVGEPLRIEPQDAGGYDTTYGTNQRLSSTVVSLLPSLMGETHTVEWQARGASNRIEAYVHHSAIIAFRVI